MIAPIGHHQKAVNLNYRAEHHEHCWFRLILNECQREMRMWARSIKVQYASTCLYLYSTCKLIRSRQTVWCRGVSCTQNRIKRIRYSTPAWCFTQLIAPWRLRNTSQTFLVTEKQGDPVAMATATTQWPQTICHNTTLSHLGTILHSTCAYL